MRPSPNSSSSLVPKEWSRRAQDQIYEFTWIRRTGQVKVLALTQKVVDGPEPAIHPPLTSTKVVHDGGYQDDIGLYAEFGDVFGFPIGTVSSPVCRSRCSRCLRIPRISSRGCSWNQFGDLPFPFHVGPVLQRTSSWLEYLKHPSSNPTSASSNSATPLPSSKNTASPPHPRTAVPEPRRIHLLR